MISYLYTHQTHHYIYIAMSFCLPCARMYHLCDQDSRLSGKDKFWKLRLKREGEISWFRWNPRCPNVDPAAAQVDMGFQNVYLGPPATLNLGFTCLVSIHFGLYDVISIYVCI